MFTFLKRPLYVLSNKMRRQSPAETATSEKWTADFSSTAKSVFNITSEISYDANLEKRALSLGLKKKNCVAWVETGERYYDEMVIEARFRLDGMGGYAAAGLMFRVMERNTYYVALVSSKGYFRVDAVKDSAPLPLIGWTEAPGLNETGTNLTIIARADKMIFLVNGRWIAEANDASIPGGHLGFTLVSYDLDEAEAGSDGAGQDSGDSPPKATISEGYTCRVWLDYFSLDSRSGVVGDYCKKWDDSAAISAESRLRLAETFAALGKDAEALDQIRKAWKRREEAAQSVTATYTEMRDRRELLLAARVAARLGLYDDAEEFINACLALDSARPAERFPGDEARAAENFPGEEAFAEKAKILSVAGKYSELAKFLPQYIARKKNDAALHALLGHAHWNLNDYESAADAWCTAFDLDRENGLYAANAANACECLGNTGKALRLRLEGGRLFLRQDNSDELGALIPKLLAVGGDNWEARALAGKWAFAVADYQRAEDELARADEFRRGVRPLPPPDPAVSYLRGVLLARRDKPRQAIRFFEEAARHAPDYGLFRFKLAEARYRAADNPHDEKLAADIQAALALMPDDAELKEFAEKIEHARQESPPPALPETAEPPAAKKSATVKKSIAAKPVATEKNVPPAAALAEKPKVATKTAAITAKTPMAEQKSAVAKKAAKTLPATAAKKTKAVAKAAETALPPATKTKTTAKTAAVEKDSKKATVKPAAKKSIPAKKSVAAKTPVAEQKSVVAKKAAKNPLATVAKKPKTVAKAAETALPSARETKATVAKTAKKAPVATAPKKQKATAKTAAVEKASKKAMEKTAAKKPAPAKKSAVAKMSKARSTAKKAQPPAAAKKTATAKNPPAAVAKKTKNVAKKAAPAVAKKPGTQAKKPASPKKPR